MHSEKKFWNQYKEELYSHRRWLHRHPELAMQERETSCYIAKYLNELGISAEILGETGVIGNLTVDPALPTFALRGEMDAVPVGEETGLDFASENPGIMHACGHDAIVAVLLCLARVLAEHRESLKCNVRFLFEPAEETGEGARYMISHGALENPRPAGILIFHFGNQETRAMEIQRSISTAAIGGLHIRIRGKASHFSQYDEGIDAMYGAARLVTAVREINDNFQTQYPFVLGLGWMQAGRSGNIVPGEAELKGSLRTFTEEDFKSVYQELQRQIELIQCETGVTILPEVTKRIPPIINDQELVRRGRMIGQAIFGDKFYLGENPFLVGDNAAYYMEQVPGMRAVFLAGKPGEAVWPVHNPKFDIEESVMLDAVQFLAEFLWSEVG